MTAHSYVLDPAELPKPEDATLRSVEEMILEIFADPEKITPQFKRRVRAAINVTATRSVMLRGFAARILQALSEAGLIAFWVDPDRESTDGIETSINEATVALSDFMLVLLCAFLENPALLRRNDEVAAAHIDALLARSVVFSIASDEE